jgi:hypothetical protein
MDFSTLDNPRLEFAFACTLRFTRVQTVPDAPSGGTAAARSDVDSGEFEGRTAARAGGAEFGR